MYSAPPVRITCGAFILKVNWLLKSPPVALNDFIMLKGQKPVRWDGRFSVSGQSCAPPLWKAFLYYLQIIVALFWTWCTYFLGTVFHLISTIQTSDIYLGKKGDSRLSPVYKPSSFRPRGSYPRRCRIRHQRQRPDHNNLNPPSCPTPNPASRHRRPDVTFTRLPACQRRRGPGPAAAVHIAPVPEPARLAWLGLARLVPPDNLLGLKRRAQPLPLHRDIRAD